MKEITEVNFYDQLKKFVVKGLLGFQTILIYGIGRRLGIFEYLSDQTKDSDPDEIIFTPDAITESLKLDATYFDAWLHMAFECGFFIRRDSQKKEFQFAPYVFYLLVDKNQSFFMGDILHGFYYMAPFQDKIVEYFKTGERMKWEELPEDARETGNRMSALMGGRILDLFCDHFSEFIQSNLSEGGNILEVGCGYGFHLLKWAEKFPKTILVGIDIDLTGINYAMNMINEKNLGDRVNIIETTIEEYTKERKSKFDVILINQVLHEMPYENSYRLKVLNSLYQLLKEEGLLIVGENLIPDTFSTEKAQYYEVMHKWFEVGIGSRFYNKHSIEEFFSLSDFSEAEFIASDNLRDYFWVVKK